MVKGNFAGDGYIGVGSQAQDTSEEFMMDQIFSALCPQLNNLFTTDDTGQY